VKNEGSLNNFIVLAIFLPKIIEFSENLIKLWQNNFDCFFSETQCSSSSSSSSSRTRPQIYYRTKLRMRPRPMILTLTRPK